MYIRVLKNRNVRYYMIGASFSNLGNVIAGFAFLFLASDLTESNVHTTGMVISQVFPYLLFGLIGGVIGDWVNKKKLMVVMDLLRGLTIISLVFLYHFDQISYWYLIVVSFLIHSMGCFFNPAHRAILPMITNVEDRTAVNSLLDSVTRGATVLGPIVSVTLLNTIGVRHFFTFDAVTYLLSAFLIYKIQINDVNHNTVKERTIFGIYHAIKEFGIWTRNHVPVRNLLIVTFVMVFLNTWVWQVGLLLQLKDTIPNPEEWYSILLGWYGITVIFVNGSIPFIWKRLKITHYLADSIVWGLGIFIIGFAYSLPIYFVGVLVAAIGLPISGLSRVYLLQEYLPKDMLGRGFSFNAFLLYLSNTISLAVFGVGSMFVDIHSLFIFCGFLMIVLGFIYLSGVIKTPASREKVG